MQKWGHRTIAAIQLIPLIGIIASLIERIVVLACITLRSNPAVLPKPAPTVVPQAALPRAALPQARPPMPPVQFPSGKNNQNISHIAGFLTLSESASLASVAKTYADAVWQAQAKLLNIAIPTNQSPRLNTSHQKALELLEFCKHIDICQKFLASIGNIPPLKQAKALREWLVSSSEVAKLDILNLKGKQLKAIPPEIKHFAGLSNLNLSNNQLTTLPPEIGTLAVLRNLTVQNNQLSVLPQELSQLTNLWTLDLEHNQLVEFPGFIKNWVDLTSLDLSHNQLTSLPIEIGSFSSLESLNVSHNQIATLPSEIANLNKLTILDVCHNQLRDLPATLNQVPILFEINASHNQLTSFNFPNRSNSQIQLRGLDLSHNQLRSLPDIGDNLKNELEVNLDDNLALPGPSGASRHRRYYSPPGRELWANLDY